MALNIIIPELMCAMNIKFTITYPVDSGNIDKCEMEIQATNSTIISEGKVNGGIREDIQYNCFQDGMFHYLSITYLKIMNIILLFRLKCPTCSKFRSMITWPYFFTKLNPST